MCICGPRPGPSQRGECPVSGTAGKTVEILTVKALLTETALRRITNSSYRFCPEPACDVVYFTENGDTYGKADLRVPVWQKEPFGARILCYCFGESEAGIRDEIDAEGASHAVERIRALIEAGRCACEVRNPRGACCLGDVSMAVKRITATVLRTVEAGHR
ncbi:MAG: copper chaperone Copz family protein [Acidobacteria bacterium]|nr:copper chaperone Copz family protein [Acidobacteriota bacterium]